MSEAWGHNTWSISTFGQTTAIANQDGVVEFFPSTKNAREAVDLIIDANPGDRWHPFYSTLDKNPAALAGAWPEMREQYRREYDRAARLGDRNLRVHPDEIDRLALLPIAVFA